MVEIRLEGPTPEVNRLARRMMAKLPEIRLTLVEAGPADGPKVIELQAEPVSPY